jgi:hypothetical protein
LFRGLGYELVHHGQGFYYFKGGNVLATQRLRAITLFMLVLFQDLEDNKSQEGGGSWERNLLSRVFAADALPHFLTSQRRSLLHAVGVTPATLREKVLRPMARYGILEWTGSDRFQFRSPVFRFVDLCLQLAEREGGQGGHRHDGPSGPSNDRPADGTQTVPATWADGTRDAPAAWADDPLPEREGSP